MMIRLGIGGRQERAVVDTEAREQLAALAKQLASGAITNRRFERSLPKSRDRAVLEIYAHGLWPLCDIHTEHCLAGPLALTAQQHADVARMALFLRSALPYRYPPSIGTPAEPPALLARLTLGWWDRRHRQRLRSCGDSAVWPFYSREEYILTLADHAGSGALPGP